MVPPVLMMLTLGRPFSASGSGGCLNSGLGAVPVFLDPCGFEGRPELSPVSGKPVLCQCESEKKDRISAIKIWFISELR